ncbi:MAG: GTP-binding protein [Nannocystaceae bacterium]
MQASDARDGAGPDDGAAIRETMNIVIVGHVDHGKSTLVGRLLADTGTLPKGKLESVKATCDRTGKVFEYAFLLDALEAEQDQGITIDAARVFFRTDRRDYIIIDAPGHIEFLKNMVTGAARAEAAILLIDAAEGVQENSRRHGYLLAMLGIRQVVVVVNKMDLVGYSRDAFVDIAQEYRRFLAEIDVTPQHIIPVSARAGELITGASAQMPWYDGPAVLEAIDAFEKQPARHDLPLRVPVQDVYKWGHRGDDRRIVAGRVESGRVRVGDEVLFSPSGKRSRIASIEGFNLPAPPQEVVAGRSTGVTLTEQLYVERGEIMSHVDHPPSVGSGLRVKLFWLGRKPMTRGRSYKLKLATAETAVSIAAIHRVLDASELGSSTGKDRVERHDVADLELHARKPVALDLAHEIEGTSRFVIVDGFDIAGGGIVSEVFDGPALGQAARDASALRRARLGHPATLVLIAGDPEAPELRDLGRALERRLLDGGHHAYAALGLSHGAARALLDAGLVIITIDDADAPALHAAAEELRDAALARVVVDGEPGPEDISIQTGAGAPPVEQLLVALAERGRLRS